MPCPLLLILVDVGNIPSKMMLLGLHDLLLLEQVRLLRIFVKDADNVLVTDRHLTDQFELGLLGGLALLQRSPPWRVCAH